MLRKKKTAKVDLEEIREKLLERRSEILKKAEEHNIHAGEVLKGDLADQSTDLCEREMMLGMAEGDRAKLRDIEAALETMDKNSYGICDECKEPIPIKRLIALPTARYCVNCQQQLERSGRL